MACCTHVIFDLDGTLLDTELVVDEVCKELVSSYGKQWNSKNLEKRLGKRPLEAAAAIVDDYQLPCSPEDLLKEITAKVITRWSKARALPGAKRVLDHFRAHNIPMALASNSPRRNITAKLSCKPGWAEYFSFIVAGDEVTEGKPSPEIYLTTAKQLDADPSRCLVVEDSPTGILAGKEAGMVVVAVPSLPSKAARPQYAPADHIIVSLLDLKPQLWGLPPFQDWVAGALPIDPWYISGPVIKGHGRGSKLLGIPTANLPAEAVSRHVAQHVCGIYLGWAGLSNCVYKMVMSVGWNPYFGNTEKTVESWLLHDFQNDFYGEELRLVVVGYIRPEADFESIEDLTARMLEDKRLATAALDLSPYTEYQNDSSLKATR